jgi:hypothetical protein
MQRCVRGPARRSIASAVAIAAMLSLTRPALPEDAQAGLDAYVNSVDAQVELYLKKHPVRPSLLFDSASSLVGTLGQFHVMEIDQCQFEPISRAWQDELPGLRENTIVALGASYANGEKKYRAGTPPVQAVVDRSSCAEDKRNFTAILRELKALTPALRKQGY